MQAGTVDALYHYTVYGLSLDSTLPLPELSPCRQGAGSLCDIQVWVGKVPPVPDDARVVGPNIWARAAAVWILYPQAGWFYLPDGHEIRVEPEPGVDERVLRLYLLGVCLGVLLHQRGLLTLHAGAVILDGEAVAFAGVSGVGKSTMTAAMHHRGHAVVADDVVAVDLSDPHGPRVFPGFPQMKLFPDVAASLGHDPAAMPVLHPDLKKVGHRVAGQSGTQPLRLAGVYVLAEGTEPGVELLGPQEALVETIRHSYAVGLVDASEEASAHFRHCAALVRSTPVARLKRPLDLGQLSRVAALVEMDTRKRESQ